MLSNPFYLSLTFDPVLSLMCAKFAFPSRCKSAATYRLEEHMRLHGISPHKLQNRA